MRWNTLNPIQQIFQYNNRKVRTLLIDNEPWFVAKDVCEVLEISKYRDAASRLDDDERESVLVDTLGGKQSLIAINESGLYNLIFTSRKDEAKKFKKWITSQVLPTIRKTGGYVANEDMFINTYLSHADDQTKALFRVTLASVRKLNEENAIMQPKAEYFDALVDRNLLTNFRDTAKELEVKQQDFINWLLDKGYVYRDTSNKLKPYSKFVPELFKLKEFTRGNKAGVQTMITPRGRETFRILIKKAVS